MEKSAPTWPSLALPGLQVYLVLDPLAGKAQAVSLLEALKRHFSDRGIAADVTMPPA